jgi:hypothetical protein
MTSASVVVALTEVTVIVWVATLAAVAATCRMWRSIQSFDPDWL